MSKDPVVTQVSVVMMDVQGALDCEVKMGGMADQEALGKMVRLVFKVSLDRKEPLGKRDLVEVQVSFYHATYSPNSVARVKFLS